MVARDNLKGHGNEKDYMTFSAPHAQLTHIWKLFFYFGQSWRYFI